MPRIVISQSHRLLRAILAKILKDGGYQRVSVAATASETIAKVADLRPALLLIDLDSSMTGGIRTVSYLRRLPLGQGLQIFGLTAARDRETMLSYHRAGVCALIINENVTSDYLVERVQRAVGPPRADGASDATESHAPIPLGSAPPATAKVRPATVSSTPAVGQATSAPAPLERQQVETMLATIAEAKALRPIVQQVLMMAGNPNTDVSALASVLRNDLALSAKVIAASNSAFYRRQGGQAKNLADAVGVIGLKGTRELAMSLSVVDQFRSPHDDPPLSMERLWGHSIAVAHVCEAVCARLGTCDPDQGFVVGLLHDLGRRLMADHMTAHYEAILKSDPATAPPLTELERKVSGADHAWVGGGALERWGCPAFVTRAVRMHHSQVMTKGDSAEQTADMVRALTIADAMAIGLGYESDLLEELPDVPRPLLQRVVPAAEASAFVEQVNGSLQERLGVVMSRADLHVELPGNWRGNVEQIVLLGALVHPLDPLQLALTNAYRGVQVVTPAAAQQQCDHTLIVADLREATTQEEIACRLSALGQGTIPANWPLLLVAGGLAPGDLCSLGLAGRKARLVSPPLRLCVLRQAVESMLSEASTPTRSLAA